MLTVGMGGQTAGEYRAQFYLWAILGAVCYTPDPLRSFVCIILLVTAGHYKFGARSLSY